MGKKRKRKQRDQPAGTTAFAEAIAAPMMSAVPKAVPTAVPTTVPSAVPTTVSSAVPATVESAVPSGEDLRQVARVAMAVEVSLESDNNFYAGVTDNVSSGGVFVATYQHPPRGAEVALELGLGDAERYHLRGIVTWVRDPARASEYAPPGCGIRWIDLPLIAEQAIERFLERRDTILYDDD